MKNTKKAIKEHAVGERDVIGVLWNKMLSLLPKTLVKHYHGIGCESVTGDYLYFCKNVFDSFDAKNCEDIKYCATAESFKDCYDCNYSPANPEICNECLTIDGFHLISCHKRSQPVFGNALL